MRFDFVIPVAALSLVLAGFSPCLAGLSAVSGIPEPAVDAVAADGKPAEVAISLANGFPLWYSDGTLLSGGPPLKLAQCLDSAVEIDGLPGSVDPCEMLRIFPQFPPSLANLVEVLYWQAEAGFNFVSSSGGGVALLVLALEGGGANENALVDGNQAVFSRIRLRIDVPVAGTYRVTHPFGSFDYVVTVPGLRSIDQTQDVGVDQAQNFLAALRDRNPFVIPTPFNPAEDDNGVVVNSSGATIGPFLVPTQEFSVADLQGGPVAATNGNRYIGLPFMPGFAAVLQPVEGSTFFPEGDATSANYFRIELLNPPNGFQLNPGGSEPQVLQSGEFLVIGKLFDDGPNEPPTAPDVTVAVLKGRSSVDIDLFAGSSHDALDPVNEDENVHGIDPQAVALADPVTGVFRSVVTGMPLLSAPQTTPSGGTVNRISRLATGESLFRYAIPLVAGDAFSDTFHYVVQDTGGLLSDPAAVTVVVEDLKIDRADFRVRTGKWRIRGTTDHPEGNEITLFARPGARLSGEGLDPETPLSGDISLFPRENAIDYRFRIEEVSGQPSITSVNLHVLGPGQPAIFPLCGNPFISPFPPPCTAGGDVLEVASSVTGFDLLPAPAAGVTTFVDAVDAILRGDAYVNVVTANRPGGEIRGAVTMPQIGVASVDATGRWEFRGRNRSLPGHFPGVIARSAMGVQTLAAPASLR